MRPRDAAWLEGVVGAAIALLPPLALVLATLRHVARRRLPAVRPWLVAWAAFALPIGVSLTTPEPAVDLIAQVAAGIVVGAVFVAWRPRASLVGLTVGLALLALAAGVEREASRSLWSDAATPQRTGDLLRGVSRLAAHTPGWTRNDVRLIPKTWHLGAGTSELTLSFDVRTLDAVEGWQWYLNSSATSQERAVDAEGVAFTILSGIDRPIVRRARVDAPIGGTRVRATFEARAPQPLQSEGCTVQLRTFEPSFSACAALTAARTWTRQHVEAAFPDEVEGRTFELAIGPVPGLVELRQVTIETLLEGEWVAVPLVEPAGGHVRLPLPGVHLFDHPVLALPASPTWERVELHAEHAALATLDEITPLLQLERGTTIELRDVTLRAASAARQPRPAPTGRPGLWLDHPNTLGHTAAVLGATALALAIRHGGARLALVATGLAALCVVLSGSRAAWIGLALAGLWLLPRLLPPRARALARVAAAGVVVVGALAGGGALGRFDLSLTTDGNILSRPEIWSTAVAAWRHDPLHGGGGDAIAAAWSRERPGDPRSPPAHAHNLWLGYAASHGTPGLLAVVWLSTALLVIGWRRGGATGIGLVATVLLMNVFDLTLPSAGVLAALVLGLDGLRRDGPRTPTAEGAAGATG